MLKKIASKILLTLLILFHTVLLHAADQKVMVSIFESKTDDDELAKRASIISAKEVMWSKGFIYVSPTDFVKAVIGNGKMVKKNSVDLEKEYSAKGSDEILEMCKAGKGSMDNVAKCLEAADIAIGGNVGHKGDLVKIEATITNMKSQRFYSTIVECREDHMDDEMRKAIKGLLEKISKADKVYADKLIDSQWSKVIYIVKTMDEKEITMEMDYTSDRPNPELQNASIIPPDGLNKNGVTTLNVMSEEGKIVEIDFSHKLGKLGYVKVDTTMPDPSKNTKQSETLTLKSKAGYLLGFEFVWENGSMTTSKISPKINPFGDAE